MNDIVCRLALLPELFTFPGCTSQESIREQLSQTLQAHPQRIQLLEIDTEDIKYIIFIRPFRLRSWIDEPKLVLYGMCKNPHPYALDYIFDRLSRNDDTFNMVWSELSGVEEATERMLAHHRDKICPYRWNRNPHPLAIDYLLDERPDLIHLHIFCQNRGRRAILYCADRPDQISWHQFVLVESPDILPVLETNLHRVDWRILTHNRCPQIAPFMIQHIHQIPSYALNRLSGNTSDVMVEFLLSHPDMICPSYFSANSNDRAVEYLISHPSQIAWNVFAQNPNPRAIEYLLSQERNIERMGDDRWKFLFWNKGPEMLPYLRDNVEAIRAYGWNRIMSMSHGWTNPHLLPLFEEFAAEINAGTNWVDWCMFSQNPGIFET